MSGATALSLAPRPLAVARCARCSRPGRPGSRQAGVCSSSRMRVTVAGSAVSPGCASARSLSGLLAAPALVATRRRTWRGSCAASRAVDEPSLSVVMPVHNEARAPARDDRCARRGGRAEATSTPSSSSSTTARPTGARRSRDGARRAGCPHASSASRTAVASRRGVPGSRRRAASGCCCSTHACGCDRRASRSSPGASARTRRLERARPRRDRRKPVRRVLERPRRARVARRTSTIRATTSFGAEDFDRYPKGTTCFLAPRALARWPRSSIPQLGMRTCGYANDDTPLIRWIAERERIHLSPSFACDYQPRTTLRRVPRDTAVHRGTVFLDGHGRPESRFFPVVVAFYPGERRARARVARAGRSVAPAALAGRRLAGAAPSRTAHGRAAFEIAVAGALDARLRRRARRSACGGAWRRARSRRSLRVILVVFGTTGELIKLAPVLLRLERRGHRVRARDDGPAGGADPSFLDQFGLRQPDSGSRAARAAATSARTATSRAGSRRSAARSAAPARVCGARSPRARASARSRPRRHDDDGARRRDGSRAARPGRAHRGRAAELRPAPPVSRRS